MKKNAFTAFSDPKGENKMTLHAIKSKKFIASLRGKSLTGFTLVELMLTVIVIAILVSIAIPNYINTAERARAREARATLASIIAAEQTYDAERRQLIPLTTGNDAAWLAIGLDNPNNNAQRSWDYIFDDTSGSEHATASRIKGPYATEQIILYMDGTEGGNWSP